MRPRPETSCRVLALLAMAAAAGVGPVAAQPPGAVAAPAPLAERLPQDEVIYFVLPDRFENGDPGNDRGGIAGGPLEHGFAPTRKGFYNGGDLEGVIERLDYIQGLGATAIWLTPIFRNKPVQGLVPGSLPTAEAGVSAGYHGYWITDFLDVDPHLGTREDFRRLVEAAHARGLKVYMDIITNHTADVIAYRECHDPAWEGERVGAECPYRSIADYPWTTRGGFSGEPINGGFLGDDPRHLTPANFARLVDPRWAYTPWVPDAEAGVKNPAWLNDPIYYNNRGNTRFEGENGVYGDFAGLDDLMTSHPRVVEGMIEIYRRWITDFRIDGYRVDTTRHVGMAFWRRFAPAILEHAESLGIHHFHIFGEVYDPEPGQLARFTTEGRLPAVLDFAFQAVAAAWLVDGAPARGIERMLLEDQNYARGEATAAILPTFLGNHDMGRLAGFLRRAHPAMGDAEMLARVRLGHALMMFSRGVPTIYYGDEQGFVSDGGDQDARESLFPSAVEVYDDNDLIGTDATTAEANFDTGHPLYRAIAVMAAARHAHPALRRGSQVVRHSDLEGGLLAFSRVDGEAGEELLVVLNAGSEPRRINVVVDGASTRWTPVLGACAPRSAAPASYPVEVAPLGFVVCRSVFD